MRDQTGLRVQLEPPEILDKQDQRDQLDHQDLKDQVGHLGTKVWWDLLEHLV